MALDIEVGRKWEVGILHIPSQARKRASGVAFRQGVHRGKAIATRILKSVTLDSVGIGQEKSVEKDKGSK
jgi:hypothetical protein